MSGQEQEVQELHEELLIEQTTERIKELEMKELKLLCRELKLYIFKKDRNNKEGILKTLLSPRNRKHTLQYYYIKKSSIHYVKTSKRGIPQLSKHEWLNSSKKYLEQSIRD